MTESKINIDYLGQWVGRKMVIKDDLSPFKAVALHAALNVNKNTIGIPKAGDELPLPWHWMFFVDTPTGNETGLDGHPKTGAFLPPVPLPRRMWAAGKLKISKYLRLGQEAEKSSEIIDVSLKKGSTGPLVFVSLLHTYSQDGEVCIEEEQNLVYREMPDGPSPMPPGKVPPQEADWVDRILPDPVLLFRFSALTYNGHRIHYDRNYAVEQEFYPGLVVHGPLQAVLLCNSLLNHTASSRVKEFQFRAMRPLFDSREMALCGSVRPNAIELWTQSDDGFVGMNASVKLSQREEKY